MKCQKDWMNLKKYYFNFWKEKEKSSLDFISFIMMIYLSYLVILKNLKGLINMLRNVLKE